MKRYIFGFLLAVGLIILVIVLIVRSLMSSPNGQTGTTDLSSLVGTGGSVQLTVDSPVTTDEKHNDLIINVGNYQTTVTETQGYQGQVIHTQNYPMNSKSFDIFLRALKYNGFTQGDSDPTNKDERGHCALGTRYIYQVIDSSGNEIQHFWTSTCQQGTFRGSETTIRRLFQLQIPDFVKQSTTIQF